MYAEIPSILMDTVLTVSVHNSVARIVFARLDPSNKAQPVVELCIPLSQVASVMKALSTIKRD